MTGRGGAKRIAWWTLRAHWGLGILLPAMFTDAPRGALSVTAAAYAAGIAMDLRSVRRDALSRLGAPLAVLVLAAAGADLLVGSRDILSSFTLLVLGIQSVLLLLPKRSRDGWQLCAIALLEFLAAAASTDRIVFALFAFLFLTLSAGAMWGLHLQQEGEREDGMPAGGYEIPPRAAAAALALSGAGGFLLCAGLFAVVPRLEFRLPLQRLSRGQAVTGFSETITLREVTGIKTSRRVVARVEFPAPPGSRSPAALYLRGAIYSRLDRDGWKVSGGGGAAVPRAGSHYIVGAAPGGVPLSIADIALEPSDHPALFAYGLPVAIEGRLGAVLADEEGNLALPQAANALIRYRLHFAEEAPPRRSAPSAPGKDALEIPPELSDVGAFGRKVAGEAAMDAEKAERLLGFFRTGFRYTLADPAASLHEFLFGKRAGYCEHYAAALAVMLRGAGVPARVAAGYYGGEWNDLGRYLIVRESDAHAWTEGWIGGRWVTMDATPPPDGGSPFLATTGKPGLYLDWLRHRWDKYVIHYSLRMQADAVSGGWSFLRRTGRGLRAPAGPEAPGKPLRAAALAGIAGLGLLLLYRMAAGRGNAARAGATDRLPAAYSRLARHLERHGYRPSAGTSMRGMLSGAALSHPELSETAERFLDLYHRDRFGPRPLSPEERGEAFRLAGTLRRGVRGVRAR